MPANVYTYLVYLAANIPFVSFIFLASRVPSFFYFFFFCRLFFFFLHFYNSDPLELHGNKSLLLVTRAAREVGDRESRTASRGHVGNHSN